MNIFQELLRMCETGIARDHAEVAKGEVGLRVATFLLSCPELTSRIPEHNLLILQRLVSDANFGNHKPSPRIQMKRILSLIDTSKNEYPRVINLTQDQLNEIRIMMIPYSFQVTLDGGKMGLISKSKLTNVCLNCLPDEYKVDVVPTKQAYINILNVKLMSQLREKYEEIAILDFIRRHTMSHYNKNMDYFKVVPIQILVDISRTWSPYKTHIMMEVYSPEIISMIADLEKMLECNIKQTLYMSFAATVRKLL